MPRIGSARRILFVCIANALGAAAVPRSWSIRVLGKSSPSCDCRSCRTSGKRASGSRGCVRSAVKRMVTYKFVMMWSAWSHVGWRLPERRLRLSASSVRRPEPPSRGLQNPYSWSTIPGCYMLEGIQRGLIWTEYCFECW